jgi:tetratricopeptide (TPR) repeat protein
MLLSPLFAQGPSDAAINIWLLERMGATAVRDVPGATVQEKAPAGTVSVDLLRHRLPEKARRMLLQALRVIETGDHAEAIRRLEETLAKYPDSAAWTQSLLGTEYLKTEQLTAAVTSFEQAVQLLPNDAVNRYNLGLSLVSVGQYDRAERELRRTLELDSGHARAKRLLQALLNNRAATRD